MKKMNVLSLAWKYHPSITSGVGVACEGLNNALSEFVNLTVIYPKVSKIQVKKEVVLDMEDLSNEKRKLIEREYVEHLRKTEFEVDVQLDPYYTVKKSSIKLTTKVEEQLKIMDLLVDHNKDILQKVRDKLLYEDVDVFGESVREKIFVYNRLVDELAQNIEFDIIHAHDWMTFAAGIALKNKYNKPLILHVHSLEFDRVGHKDATWVYDVERSAMSKADLVIAVSEYTKGIIESSYGLSRDKIQTIYNAVTIPKNRIKPMVGKKPGHKVLFAGRIDGNKGLKYFIEIAGYVLQLCPKAQFVVVGRGEVDFESIHGFSDVSSRLTFKGGIEREELFALYNDCDVLCMPSVSEPFGLTAIEAAFVGLPVVLSTKTGAAEILNRTPKAGFWETKKFAKHVVSLMENKTLRKRTIANNKQDISLQSWHESAKMIFRIYDQLLA